MCQKVSILISKNRCSVFICSSAWLVHSNISLKCLDFEVFSLLILIREQVEKDIREAKDTVFVSMRKYCKKEVFEEKVKNIEENLKFSKDDFDRFAENVLHYYTKSLYIIILTLICLFCRLLHKTLLKLCNRWNDKRLSLRTFSVSSN